MLQIETDLLSAIVPSAGHRITPFVCITILPPPSTCEGSSKTFRRVILKPESLPVSGPVLLKKSSPASSQQPNHQVGSTN